MKERIDFETIEWQSPMHGLRYRFFEQGGVRMRLVEYSHDFVEPNWCVKGHIGYVLEGEFDIDFSGRLVHFKPGDGIFIPPGEEHKHKPIILTDRVRVIMFEVE